MYILKAEADFDSAHFLAGYEGKCSNIHGHRWKIEGEIQTENLIEGGQLDGMIVDFKDLKGDLKRIADDMDHSFIYQNGTLNEQLIFLMNEQGFKLIEVDFRPTAENFSKYFFEKLSECGYDVRRVTVYETPTNSASYVK